MPYCPKCDETRTPHQIRLSAFGNFGKKTDTFWEVTYGKNGARKELIHEHIFKIRVEIWRCSNKHRFRIVRSYSCGCGFNIGEPRETVEILTRPTPSRMDFIVDGIDFRSDPTFRLHFDDGEQRSGCDSPGD
jgi:hypothetical protein